MAEASKGDVTVLHLTKNEAETLCCVLRKIGGSPDTTRRGHTDAVYQALRKIGYDKPYNSQKGFEMSGSMTFPDGYKRDKDGDR